MSLHGTRTYQSCLANPTKIIIKTIAPDAHDRVYGVHPAAPHNPRTTPPLRRTTPRTTVEGVGGRAGGRAGYIFHFWIAGPKAVKSDNQEITIWSILWPRARHGPKWKFSDNQIGLGGGRADPARASHAGRRASSSCSPHAEQTL